MGLIIHTLHIMLFTFFIYKIIIISSYSIYLIVKHTILYKNVPNSISRFMRLYYYVNIDKLNTTEKYTKLSVLLKFQSNQKSEQLNLLYIAIFSGLWYIFSKIYLKQQGFSDLLVVFNVLFCVFIIKSREYTNLFYRSKLAEILKDQEKFESDQEEHNRQKSEQYAEQNRRFQEQEQRRKAQQQERYRQNERAKSKPSDDPSVGQPWHEVLGVAQNATMAEVKMAYRELMKKYHPDRVAGLATEFQELANQKSVQINQAYEFAIARKVD